MCSRGSWATARNAPGLCSHPGVRAHGGIAMDQLKIIRTVCLFTAHPSEHTLAQLEHLCCVLAAPGFVIQTQRLCSPDRHSVFTLDRRTATPVLFSLGSQTCDSMQEFLAEFLVAKNVHCNVD